MAASTHRDPAESEPTNGRALEAQEIGAQWLAAQAGFREPAAIVLYSLAIVAVAGLGLLDAGRAILGPEPAALVATLGFILAVIWGASLSYHTRGPETAVYRFFDHLETTALQGGALFLIALTPGAQSLFWIVYLAHMTMLPAEPRERRAIDLLVQGGPLVVAVVFVVRGDFDGARFCVAGAVAGSLNWRRSQRAKTLLAGAMAERRRLAREVERLGIHEARLATARALHVGLGADLTQLSHDADALAARSLPSLAPELAGLAERSRASIEELRSAVWFAAQPGRAWRDLVDHLTHALNELVRDKAQVELTHTTASDDDLAIPGDVCLTLLRVMQEATRNALTHGKAMRVRVSLQRDVDVVRAAIEDDGHGPRDGAPMVGKGGLLNMQARATQLGGHLSVSASPTGTRVALAVPWRGPAASPPIGMAA